MKLSLTDVEKKFILEKYIKSGLSYKKAKIKLDILIKKIKIKHKIKRKELILKDDFKEKFKELMYYS